MSRPFAFALLLLLPPASAMADPADVMGTWLTEDGRARVRIERCQAAPERACGYVVWMRPGDGADPGRRDVHNPDPSRRGRAVLGHEVLSSLRPDGAGFAGRVYNADDGKSYDVTVWSDAKAVLSVRGCLVAFLCSTQSWRKAADVAPGQLVAATGAPGGPVPDVPRRPAAR